MSEKTIRVLLVDDQRIIGEAIKRMIEMEGDMLFLHCDSPENALKAALNFAPTVILQDLVMPGVDGLDLLQSYKAENALKDVPVIVLSSEEDIEIKLKAFRLHASDYMIKIPSRVELVARIREHAKWSLRIKQLEAALAERGAPASIALSGREHLSPIAAALSRELETPLQYVASNLMFFGDVLRSLARFRVKLARLNIPPELAAAMKEAADTEDLDFVFDDAPKALRQSQDEIARAAQIAKILALLAAPPSANTQMAGADVNAAMKLAASLLKERLASFAELKFEFAEQLPKVSARYGDLLFSFLFILSALAAALEASFGKNSGKGRLEMESSSSGQTLKIEFKSNAQLSPDLSEASLLKQQDAGIESSSAIFAAKRLVEAAGGRFELASLPEGGTSILLLLSTV